jgi:hypothetical protein
MAVCATSLCRIKPDAGISPRTKRFKRHNIGFYLKQLAQQRRDGKIPAFAYAMSQIGHEMGHRWSAFVSAKVAARQFGLDQLIGPEDTGTSTFHIAPDGSFGYGRWSLAG